MTVKEIKIKLELTSINIYAGGAEQLLDDIKNAGIVIHNDSNGYYITSESETKYSASTDYAEKLNQLKILTVLSPEETEIAKLKILFLDNETDEPYTVSDNATIEGETINLTFNSYTLTFTNTEYPQFDIELPEAMVVPEGTSVTLPSVSGTFEDEEYTYTPSAWSIGNFGESVEIDDNTTANILCSMIPKLLLPTVIADTATVGNKISVQAGSSVNLYKDSALIPYDSTKSYGGRVGDGSGGVSTWQFLFINNSGYLEIKNTTSASIYALGVSYYICSSNQAEIVFVVNSSNVKYQAFKYTQDGTDYYYVLDGVQSDWTDDLSSIGYSLEPPVPTVPVVNIYLNPNTNMYFQSNVTNRVRKQPGNMYQLYTDDTLQTPYIFDWGKRYEKGHINSETGEWVAPVRQNQSDVPAVKGDSLSLSFLANISDSSSTIGMLWLLSTTNSSGYTRYGQIAVKIYDDATSYWLNGNHTDQSVTSTYLTDIDYDSSKIYKVLAFVKENGNRDYDEYLYALNFYNNSGKLKIILSTYTSSMRFARIVLHAKNKEIYTGYFNAGDGNSEKSVTNTWAYTGDQINGVYPLNSDTGYQYRSAQYKILSVFYADGTTVTDETLAPYSISSSVKMVSNPYVSGLLSIQTMVNNKILGNPCGCTFRMELTLSFNGNNPGVNTSLNGSTSDSIQWVRLYAQNTTGGSGTEVSYDPSKVYKVLGVYKEDGTQIEATFMMGNSNNYLRLCIMNGGIEWSGAKVVYTEA